MKLKKENELITCPICGKSKLEMFDICAECFWEYDPWQYEDGNENCGANHLSLNSYKKWWAKIDEIMSTLIKKYSVTNSKVFASGKYHNLVVARNNIVSFVNELSGYGIKITANFYNICKQYDYPVNSFHGFVWSRKETPKENNDEILNVIFSKTPIKTCEEYNLVQLLEILNKSENVIDTWEKLTPNIDIKSNPRLEDLKNLYS